MANGINRTPEMEQFNEALGQAVFVQSPRECIDKAVCVDCGGDASEFNDEQSRKEYHITGLCQKCQDEIFG